MKNIFKNVHTRRNLCYTSLKKYGKAGAEFKARHETRMKIMKTIATPGAALGGYEYRITARGGNYNIGERTPGAKAFKVIAKFDAVLYFDALEKLGGRAEFYACRDAIGAAINSHDPAEYLRTARRIKALHDAPKVHRPHKR